MSTKFGRNNAYVEQHGAAGPSGPPFEGSFPIGASPALSFRPPLPNIFAVGASLAYSMPTPVGGGFALGGGWGGFTIT
jgi:hypothetical protein